MRRFALLVFFLLPLFPVDKTESIAAALAADLRVSAQSYVLMDADTGRIWAAQRPDARLPIASTTKIMTAHVALALADGELSQLLTVSDAHVRVEGSRMYLRAGETVSLEELLYGLLLVSGNDAALAIAEGLCGTVEAFVEEMNREAHRLGLAGTHFTNPSGLPDENHYSTAADLAKLMAVAMRQADFARITGTREKALTGRSVANHNRLLRCYPGLDGGKTGFTKAAGRCLVTTAARDGRRLVAVTLNAPSDWNDHTALYDYGFSLYTKRLSAAGQPSVTLAVVGGRVETLPLFFEEDVSFALTAGEQQAISLVYYLPRFVYAPVQKGAAVGRAVWMVGDTEIAARDLYTVEGATYAWKRK